MPTTDNNSADDADEALQTTIADAYLQLLNGRALENKFFEEEVESLYTKAAHLSDANQELELDKELLAEENASLTVEVQRLSTTNLALASKRDSLAADKTCLVAEVERLTAALAGKDESIATLVQEKTDLQEEKQCMVDINNSMIEDVERLEQQKRHLTKQFLTSCGKRRHSVSTQQDEEDDSELADDPQKRHKTEHACSPHNNDQLDVSLKDSLAAARSDLSVKDAELESAKGETAKILSELAKSMETNKGLQGQLKELDEKLASYKRERSIRAAEVESEEHSIKSRWSLPSRRKQTRSSAISSVPSYRH